MENGYREIEKLVHQLEIQVSKLEVIVPRVESQAATITEHGERLAVLATWSTEHEKADAKAEATRLRRYTGWSGIAGALAMKLVDWAHLHTHFNLAGMLAGH